MNDTAQRWQSMFTKYTVDGGSDVFDSDGTISVTGTSVYKSHPFIFRRNTTQLKTIHFKSTVVTGTLSMFITNDPLSKVLDGSARYGKALLSGAQQNAGTGITYTTGDGAVTAGNETWHTTSAAGFNGFTACYWQYTNSTGTGTIELTMQD